MSIESETPEETLERLGRTKVITAASAVGKTATKSVLYPSQHWKDVQRLKATNETPEDADGLGWDYTSNNGQV